MKKNKITSKTVLEYLLASIIFDDWLSTPLFKTEEERLQYQDSIRRKKLEIIEKDFDICIEDDKE